MKRKCSEQCKKHPYTILSHRCGQCNTLLCKDCYDSHQGSCTSFLPTKIKKSLPHFGPISRNPSFIIQNISQVTFLYRPFKRRIYNGSTNSLIYFSYSSQSMASIGEVVYFLVREGLDSVNIRTNRKHKLRGPLHEIFRETSLCQYNGKYLYCAGCGKDWRCCEKYDINKNKWIKLPSLNKATKFGSLHVFQHSKLYYFAPTYFEVFDLLDEEKGWEFHNLVGGALPAGVRMCIDSGNDTILFFACITDAKHLVLEFNATKGEIMGWKEAKICNKLDNLMEHITLYDTGVTDVIAKGEAYYEKSGYVCYIGPFGDPNLVWGLFVYNLKSHKVGLFEDFDKTKRLQRNGMFQS
eukprot:TRINITY_DN137867_c0_g1_i1.p1 TRINITY_DN137867_c0_g1~~TRINITY_DN137867_c0_g1_i1.p1  ORF type:complete len:352 (-),score=4.93 TRINITY_DN137867_c0_g1_i1:116-1171(-)